MSRWCHGTSLACGEPVVLSRASCAAACPAVKQFDANTVQQPGARASPCRCLDLLDDKVDAVREAFTPELQAELAGTKLTSIVNGLIAAHGPPTQIVDAWSSEIKEKEEVMPASQVLIHMTNGVRVSLLFGVRAEWRRQRSVAAPDSIESPSGACAVRSANAYCARVERAVNVDPASALKGVQQCPSPRLRNARRTPDERPSSAGGERAATDRVRVGRTAAPRHGVRGAGGVPGAGTAQGLRWRGGAGPGECERGAQRCGDAGSVNLPSTDVAYAA